MPRTPMFNDDQVQKMRDSYVLGRASLARIASDFGASVPTIAKCLRKAGVEIRKRGRPQKIGEPQANSTPEMAAPNVVEDVFTPRGGILPEGNIETDEFSTRPEVEPLVADRPPRVFSFDN